ncbi:BLUF domain-containing protein [Aquimarina latercula]|uniref:BLUF domain-containing protein n=1 Tax=Aquimarina latercula TaxID=987 RepID=UPI0004057C28|nr:BLUF domain-containing protein [Aquimarina latercula]
MLRIEKNDEIEQLRQMANHFRADFKEYYNSGKLVLDNERGKGYISTYQVFPGLVAKTYNVRFNKELKFIKNEKGEHPIYFIYCVKGYYFHKFGNEDSLEKISKSQNVILSGNELDGHEIILPGNVDLEISILFLNVSKFEKLDNRKARRLDSALKELAKNFKLDENKKYFGEINLETSQFAEVLVRNERIDTIGMLITEGSILNTLASQLINHEEHREKIKPKRISKSDLKKIIDLGVYIKENIDRKINIDELTNISGLRPHKLQKGCNYLYGESVGNLIQRLRVERARQLLQNTEFSVSEVCYKVGFSSRSYFSKIFEQYFGMLPSNFKMSIDNGAMIFELCYTSKAITGLTTSSIEDIVSESISKNLDNSITGALVFYKKVFFQIIEGPKSNILELYRKLLQDNRHFDVELIWQGVKTKRIFDDWSMAFLAEDDNQSSEMAIGNITYAKLAPIMEGLKDSEVFSDILWRRVLNILKTSA